ncbi:MAG: DoxX family protein [Halobacteriales archaeon]|nr:DoxX family protein [Halobacteriales archaeon]
MVVSGIEGIALLFGRLLFGGVLAFMGLNHFLQTDQMAGYAEHKGLPAPRLAVLASGGVLVLGGLSIVAGIFPVIGAIAVAGFLVSSGLLMHDFWAVPEDQQQDELTQFLKNTVMAGGALTFAALASESWTFSLNIGLV